MRRLSPKGTARRGDFYDLPPGKSQPTCDDRKISRRPSKIVMGNHHARRGECAPKVGGQHLFCRFQFRRRTSRTRLAHVVLAQSFDDVADGPKRDRLFETLMRRLDAMAPYRDGLREVVAWVRRDPIAALRMNSRLVNSLRFMLEAAGSKAKAWRAL